MAGATEIVEMFDIEARRAGRWTGLVYTALLERHQPVTSSRRHFFGARERCTNAKRLIRSDIVLPT